MQVHLRHPHSHSHTPSPQGSMLHMRTGLRRGDVRKHKITQRQLPRARANIEFRGKGFRHVRCAHIAYRMMYTLLPRRCCCELSSVNRREMSTMCVICVLRFRCQTKLLCSVRILDRGNGRTSHAAHCTDDAGRETHSTRYARKGFYP